MTIGKELLVTLYAIIILLGGVRPAGLFMFHEVFEKNELRVVYALNGGENHEDNKTIITKEDFPFALEIPTREGYNFAGWYTDSNYKNKITELNQQIVSEIVLYAKWTEKIDNYYNVEKYSYNYYTEDEKVKALKDCEYYFLEEVEIPSMPKTRESDYRNHYTTDTAQTMQGLCYTPEYILMTAYAQSDNSPGMLMVFDRESGEYLISLQMDKESHLGGVAFDGENVWVCHSQNNTLERISYSLIDYIAKSGTKYCVDATGVAEEYAIINSPSCITCYGGRIWVATHTELFNGTMVSYSYDMETKQLVPLCEYQIPKKVQGVAFDDEGYVYLSTSLGRKNSSYLKAYTSLLTLDANPSEPATEIEMPPCSEGVVFVEDSLIILFESASEKYFEGTDGLGTSTAPLDSLLKIETASIW